MVVEKNLLLQFPRFHDFRLADLLRSIGYRTEEQNLIRSCNIHILILLDIQPRFQEIWHGCREVQ